MISSFAVSIGFDLVDIITGLGILAIIFVVFAESGLLIGFFLPGDSLLFTAGLLVQTNALPINIHLFILTLIAAAILGDNVGYFFGKKVGSNLYNRPNSRLFKKHHLEKAEKFYEKHGGKTIILARFTPVVRTFAPIVAGASNMNYKKFFTFNVIGALLWAGGITYLGYFSGSALKSLGIDPDSIILPFIVIIVLFSLLPAAYQIVKNKEIRDSILSTTKKQLKKFTKSK